MNVTLTPRHQRYIAAKVKSGAYGSVEEVIREGLRLLQADNQRRQRVEWLQTEIERGFNGMATPWNQRDSDKIRRLITARARGKS